jgi:hypothetical protein
MSSVTRTSRWIAVRALACLQKLVTLRKSGAASVPKMPKMATTSISSESV